MCIPSSSRHMLTKSVCGVSVTSLLQKFVYVTYTAIHSVMRETHLEIVAEHRVSYLLTEDMQTIILTSCESETFKHQM